MVVKPQVRCSAPTWWPAMRQWHQHCCWSSGSCSDDKALHTYLKHTRHEKKEAIKRSDTFWIKNHSVQAGTLVCAHLSCRAGRETGQTPVQPCSFSPCRNPSRSPGLLPIPACHDKWTHLLCLTTASHLSARPLNQCLPCSLQPHSSLQACSIEANHCRV